MNKPEIILVGGGGHCISCIDVIELENKYKIAGIIDIKENIGKKVLCYTIIGTDDDIDEISKKYKNFLITIGFIKDVEKRLKIYHKLKTHNVTFPVVISPKSYVSKHAKIAQGTIIMHGVVINAGAQIKENCIINTNATIEHEVQIGSNCHISTNTVVNGQAIIGANSFVGSNAVIKNNITITDKVIIGAGAVVVSDINTEGIYVGTPVKRIIDKDKC